MAGNNRAIQSPFPRCAHFYTGRRCTRREEVGTRSKVPLIVGRAPWQRSRRQRKKYIYRAEAFSERANTILNAQSGFEKVTREKRFSVPPSLVKCVLCHPGIESASFNAFVCAFIFLFLVLSKIFSIFSISVKIESTEVDFTFEF